MRIIDYRILNDESVDGLAGQVKDEINKDWEPIGGVCVIVRSTVAWGGVEVPTPLFYQAMVKYAEKGSKEPENFRQVQMMAG